MTGQRTTERTTDLSSLQIHNVSLELTPERTGGLVQKPLVIQIPDGVQIKIRDITINITIPPKYLLRNKHLTSP